jgi:hypothetical protein
MVEKRKLNEAQRARVENTGILLASGLIAGEALTGLLFAPLKIANIDFKQRLYDPHVMIGFVIITLIALVLIYIPMRNAGKPDEPAPPHAMV